ncbi:agmatinase [candidate division WOR-3 bacterium]|nr:agmatinase [candidate division WOR-3 bacterium]
MAFWFAKSRRKDARVVILGVALDETACYIPGTRFGPDRIRACAETVESYSPFFKYNLTCLNIFDDGNIELEGLPGIETKLKSITQKIQDWINNQAKPLLIGGEHTLTLGAVHAVLKHYPDLVVLQLDAHADMRDMGERGGKITHDTVMRRIVDILKPNSLIQVGLRSFAEEEIEAKGIQRFKIDEPRSIIKAINNRPIWLTFDLDLLDPSIMPAVGTPEPNGATYKQVIDLLLALKGENIVGADLVEFNPLAADFVAPCVLAANLVRELCCLMSF